ncbi:hypothetical protein J0S82_002546 [Galemys pyrenaicus]|uniref:Uncharacterized protein n=1 Tax=Galemys pyrenaicus TaxID=202257 RepID=A0A8J6DNZ0_GALPY|nr:hypothetical protein J0S82_002546 [Galemys pyrenaicus]
MVEVARVGSGDNGKEEVVVVGMMVLVGVVVEGVVVEVVMVMVVEVVRWWMGMLVLPMTAVLVMIMEVVLVMVVEMRMVMCGDSDDGGGASKSDSKDGDGVLEMWWSLNSLDENSVDLDKDKQEGDYSTLIITSTLPLLQKKPLNSRLEKPDAEPLSMVLSGKNEGVSRQKEELSFTNAGMDTTDV